MKRRVSTSHDKASSCRILPSSPLRNYQSTQRGMQPSFQNYNSTHDDPGEVGYEDDFASLEEDEVMFIGIENNDVLYINVK